MRWKLYNKANTAFGDKGPVLVDGIKLQKQTSDKGQLEKVFMFSCKGETGIIFPIACKTLTFSSLFFYSPACLNTFAAKAQTHLWDFTIKMEIPAPANNF